jgi:Uma2 family endonuclease
VAARIKEHATYDDLLRAPENMVAELIDGELHTWPRPRARHGDAQAALGFPIGMAYRYGEGGPGGWWIIAEPEVHLGPQTVVPDIAGWRRERLPELPQSHIFAVAPDWVCEVLSPSTARVDRGKKLRIYATNGVPWAWYVDVDGKTVEVMHLVDGVWHIEHVYTGGELMCAEPFTAVSIDLAKIWGADAE